MKLDRQTIQILTNDVQILCHSYHYTTACNCLKVQDVTVIARPPGYFADFFHVLELTRYGSQLDENISKVANLNTVCIKIRVLLQNGF